MSELLTGGSWAGGWDEPGVLSAVLIGTTIPGSGLFVYQGTPALGSLIASITTSSPDLYGNVTQPGITDYRLGNVSKYVELTGGAINITDTNGNLWILNAVPGSPATVFQITPPGGSPSSLYVTSSGFIQANLPGTPGTQESPHAMSGFTNSWATLASTPARYQLMGDGTVQIDGVMDASAATAGAFFTIPAAYRPATNSQLYPGGANGGVIAGNAPFITVTTAGVMSVGGVTLPTAGAHVTITGRYPLN